MRHRPWPTTPWHAAPLLPDCARAKPSASQPRIQNKSLAHHSSSNHAPQSTKLFHIFYAVRGIKSAADSRINRRLYVPTIQGTAGIMNTATKLAEKNKRAPLCPRKTSRAALHCLRLRLCVCAACIVFYEQCSF